MTSENQNPAIFWANYWQEARQADNFETGGIGGDLTRVIWSNIFDRYLDSTTPKVIELASGYGSICQVLIDLTLDNQPLEPHLTAVDFSSDVLQALAQKYPSIQTLEMDLSDTLPNFDGCDWVVSQFGIEYSGLKTICQVISELPANCKLACLMHHRDSLIYKESLAIVQQVSELMASSLLHFENNPALQLLGTKKSDNRLAEKLLKKPLQLLNQQIVSLPQNFLNGYCLYILNGLQHVSRNYQFISTKQFDDWLKDVDSQLQSTLKRSQSMLAAALSDEDFGTITNIADSSNFELLLNRPYRFGNSSEILGQMFIGKRVV